MDNYMYPDELQHWGIKGMRWGQRRYQNKDGSLTPAGQKRYNKEMAKLDKEEAKLRDQARVVANRKKTQSKIDALESRKKALENKKKKLKDGDEDDSKKKEETLDEKRERLLKSTDAKELYKNKDILTDQEIQSRINRIDLEARLNSKIVEEKQVTGRDKVNEWMDNTSETLGKATNLYRKVDDAYSTVTKSAIGKSLAKTLGLEVESKPWDWNDFAKNINKKSSQEIAEASKRAINEKNVKKHVESLQDEANAAKKAKKDTEAVKNAERLKEAQKQVDDYNQQREAEYEKQRTARESQYSKKGKDVVDSMTQTHVTALLEDKSSAGRTYVNNSDYLQGRIVTDSNGNIRIIYDED